MFEQLKLILVSQMSSKHSGYNFTNRGPVTLGDYHGRMFRESSLGHHWGLVPPHYLRLELIQEQ